MIYAKGVGVKGPDWLHRLERTFYGEPWRSAAFLNPKLGFPVFDDCY